MLVSPPNGYCYIHSILQISKWKDRSVLEMFVAEMMSMDNGCGYAKSSVYYDFCNRNEITVFDYEDLQDLRKLEVKPMLHKAKKWREYGALVIHRNANNHTGHVFALTTNYHTAYDLSRFKVFAETPVGDVPEYQPPKVFNLVSKKTTVQEILKKPATMTTVHIQIR